ncbi:MAG: hypothetical protein JO212_11765 [Acetobacteraceae bacterium]|nr:hypothetical protein [Acetobacteraceae bacterium]
MSRTVTYEAAVQHVMGLRRVKHFDLARQLGIHLTAALKLLQRMQQEGIVGPMDLHGWRLVLIKPDPFYGSLLEEVRRSRELAARAVAEASLWKRRALAAQSDSKPRASPPPAASSGASDDRINKIRRLLAKELHPDACDSGGPEARVRAELFKKIWPKLESVGAA